MIKLDFFDSTDFNLFISWINNKEELFQFAGPIFTYPLTTEQLLAYSADDRRIPFKVVHIKTNEIIGHCELNFENTIPRLSRILIADSRARGKGIGKLIVDKMLEQLFVMRYFDSADLNVFDWNKGAIRCYEQVGFKINSECVNTQILDNDIWTALNMIITKELWLKNKEVFKLH